MILCILSWSRPGLAAFCLDLYSFGLVAASFVFFFSFVNFVLVSAALAAICLVLYGLRLVSAGLAVLCGALVAGN